MKKIALIFCLSILLLSFASAKTLEIEKEAINSDILAELGGTAHYNLKITNLGKTDEFRIYSLVSVLMEPKEKFLLPYNKTVKIHVAATPYEEVIKKNKGTFNFEYQIKSQTSEITKDFMKIEIIELKDLFNITVSDINPKDATAKLHIENKANITLNETKIKIISDFFETETTASIEPYGKIELSIDIEKNKIKDLVAGTYVAQVNLETQGREATNEFTFEYVKDAGLSVSESSSGFIIRETTIQKVNVGNTLVLASTKLKRNILTRLFTTFSEKPQTVTKKAFSVEYVWEKEIPPGKSLTVVATTNYTLPFLLLIFVVVIVLIVKISLEKNIAIKKKVSFVKTKGSDLALKITLDVKARRYIENIQIIDTIPRITKLFNKFGIKPDRVDAKTRKIFWDLQSLNAGEERVFSYIIYSKMKIVGKFELPAATAVYERDGKTSEVHSNKTYFAAEHVSEN